MSNNPPLKLPLNDTGSWGAKPELYQKTHYDNGVRHARHRRTAVDCGAHVGIFTRRFAQHFQQVHAIEPVNHELLRENTRHLPNVTVHPYALNSTPGLMYLTTPDATNSGWWELTDTPTELSVEVITVDSLELDDVDYIKVDTQACEQGVIQGASKTIRTFNPVIHVETRDQELLRWIEREYDYEWRSKYIKDHILVKRGVAYPN